MRRAARVAGRSAPAIWSGDRTDGLGYQRRRCVGRDRGALMYASVRVRERSLLLPLPLACFGVPFHCCPAKRGTRGRDFLL
jgi:hypothetical protein